MAETIDEATIIAWVDGELDEPAATRAAEAVAADPALAALAERHRRMKARFAAAFAPLAEMPVATPERPAATVVSLAAAREARAAAAAAASRPASRRWLVPGAIAASLLIAVVVGQNFVGGGGGGERDALALPAPTVAALDRQLSGDAGAVRVAMTFRDRGGSLCRGFTASGMASVACRADGEWRLRYATPAAAQGGDYRQAGGDAAQIAFIQSIIAGEPLDRAAETKARADRWGK